MKRHLILLALLVFTLACGPDRPTTVPVSGTVTFSGSPPPAEGMLTFAPIAAAEGYPKRGGRARFDTQGTYVVETFAAGDGLIPGTYRVTVDCWKEAPTMDRPQGGVSYVAKDFQRPEITIEVTDKSREIPIEVPLAK